MSKHRTFAAFACWLAVWQLACGAFASGAWNGTSFTAWNGVAQTGWNGTSISCASGATYLVNQGFEGTGYDNSETWTEAGTGTIDEDSTVIALAGSQSLRIILAAQTGASYVSFSGQTSVYGFWLMQTAVAPASNGRIATFRTSGGVEVGEMQGTAGGAMKVLASGGTSNSSGTAIPLNTTIWVWFECIVGSGSNTIARCGWSTTGTKPALTASGTVSCVSTNGTGTTAVARLYLGPTASTTSTETYDHVLVDDATIGDNP